MNRPVDTQLGPFYDLDGTEILPVLTEATAAAIERVMGRYQVHANIPSLDGRTLVIDSQLITRYIQDDWNRVMGEQPDIGFLAAYWSTPKAVGRLAEDIVCQQLLEGERLIAGDRVRNLHTVREAVAQGLMQLPRKGTRSDDLLLETTDGHRYLVESKASLSGQSYLRRSVPKAWRQTCRVLAINPEISHVLYVWTSLREKFIVVLALDREQTQTTSFETLRSWLDKARQPPHPVQAR
jgi:hypothetical protein